MTALLEGARNRLARAGDLGRRIEALQEAADAARGRLDEDAVRDALATAARAAGRMRLSERHTVVALAGATGSGKSSTYNALAGLDLAAVGVRRPTTSSATACVWGDDDAAPLLDWLEIPSWHRTMHDSELDEHPSGGPTDELDGVVLLDLPDHDSTEVAHHLEVDRLVGLADVLVWVLDPQKYADAAVHERYLAPLREHREVMVVGLNHIDTVAERDRPAMVADLRRLLAADGLEDVPVLALSARHGAGVADLRAEVARRARSKQSARARVEADVRGAADRLVRAGGEGPTRLLSTERQQALDDAVADAAGVPTVVEAVERSARARGTQATGWPVTRWLGRLRPDPLRRLHLGRDGDGERERALVSRTSLPVATPVQRARVDTAVRALADDASRDLARPWADAVRRASTGRVDDLGDRLDVALAQTDLRVTGLPWWAPPLRVLQWVLLALGAVGLGWLVALAAASFLGLPEPTTPLVGGLPAPTVLLLGGLLLGILLAGAARVLVRLSARRRAREVDRDLRRAVHDVAAELVVAPVAAELDTHRLVRERLAEATQR